MSSETIQIHLSLKFANRLVDNQLSSCEYYLPMIEIPQQHYLYLSLVHCMIPYSFYNINNINNCITFQLLNVQTGNVFLTNSVFINAGNYNAIQLAVHLTDILTINNFIVQYNGIINKFKFTNSQYNFRFFLGQQLALTLIHQYYSLIQVSIKSI